MSVEVQGRLVLLGKRRFFSSFNYLILHKLGNLLNLPDNVRLW